MRRSKLFTITLSVAVLFCFCGTAMAAEFSTFSNAAFSKSSVKLASTGKATFSATATTICSSIKVTTCTLQVKSGSSWGFAKSLATPSGATNCASLYVIKDYSGDLTSGKTYRIMAIFTADGGTATVYSGEITY